MTAPIVPVPGSGFWAAAASEVPILPPPDGDEIPDTEPAPDTDEAPAVVDVERVPSLVFDEDEKVTAVRVPHPHNSEVSK